MEKDLQVKFRSESKYSSSSMQFRTIVTCCWGVRDLDTGYSIRPGGSEVRFCEHSHDFGSEFA